MALLVNDLTCRTIHSHVKTKITDIGSGGSDLVDFLQNEVIKRFLSGQCRFIFLST